MERGIKMVGEEVEPEIERLPVDLLAHIFSLISSFTDLAQASGVCKKWKWGVEQSFARKEILSFAGWKVDDSSATRLVRAAYNLRELDISRSCWGCQITDEGLYMISSAKCVSTLMSISLWGMSGITDDGVTQLSEKETVTVRKRRFRKHFACELTGFNLYTDASFCEVSKAASLQHLNIGGTFITDESLYAVSNSCPHLKSIVLWSCRHVTENGLFALVYKCCKLESINVWGMRVPVDCFISLLSISPALQITPLSLHTANALPVS